MSDKRKKKPDERDDPIEKARECQEEHRRIEQIGLGYRRRLYALYGRASAIAAELPKDKSALQRFLEDDFVHSYKLRHRQQLADIDENLARIFRYVVAFIMRADSEADRKKASKVASVLTLLHKCGVAPQDVAAALENGGGVEGILAEERRRKVQELVGEEDPFEPRPANVREFAEANGWNDEVVEDDERESDETENETEDAKANEDAEENSEQQSDNDRLDGGSAIPGVNASKGPDQGEDDGWEDDDDEEETGGDEPAVVTPLVYDPNFEVGLEFDPEHEEQLASVPLGGFAHLIIECTIVEPLKIEFTVTEVQVPTEG